MAELRAIPAIFAFEILPGSTYEHALVDMYIPRGMDAFSAGKYFAKFLENGDGEPNARMVHMGELMHEDNRTDDFFEYLKDAVIYM